MAATPTPIRADVDRATLVTELRWAQRRPYALDPDRLADLLGRAAAALTP